MNVLVIASNYPPDAAVGALRASKVANAFRDAGHNVHVLCCAETPDQAGTIEAAPGLTIERFGAWPGPRDVYAGMKSAFRRARTSGAPDPDGKSEQHYAIPERVSRWKRYVFSVMMLPDDRQGWLPPVLQRAFPRIRAGVDLLYTTAPPFSVHLAGLILKRATRVRWAAEFRDPWTDNPCKLPHLRSRPTDAAERWLERKCLEGADHVVPVSDATGDVLRARLASTERNKVVVIRNGIERLLPATASLQTPGPLKIVHAGSLCHRRDPRPFLQALASLRRQGRLASPVSLRFVGDGRWYHDVSVEAVVQDLGLADWVEFTDWVPHTEVRRILDEADVLLLLAQDWALQIPQKLYEYLGSRKRILAFADADAETTRMLTMVGGHHVVTTADPRSIEDAVEAAVRGDGERTANADEALLTEWSTAHQMQLLARLAG